MKILLTGASSFTGMWFARQLSEAGHSVTATFTGTLDAYQELRRKRVELVTQTCRCVWNTAFGSETFLELARQPFDVFCHHGAIATNYKSIDFDYLAATADNTRNIREVLAALSQGGMRRLVLTDSVFEARQGAGLEPLLPFSPYGLSKTMTADIFAFWCDQFDITLARFVIPNPFGPYEEPRFTNYLMRQWAKGIVATVQTPAYIRDNIHISLLAKSYAAFVNAMATTCQPSGYVESQGDFALRFSGVMRQRFGWPCNVELLPQIDFSEPKVRFNTQIPDSVSLEWDETLAWDMIAAYYKDLLADI